MYEVDPREASILEPQTEGYYWAKVKGYASWEVVKLSYHAGARVWLIMGDDYHQLNGWEDLHCTDIMFLPTPKEPTLE